MSITIDFKKISVCHMLVSEQCQLPIQLVISAKCR
jgi:hypothetical protein